MSLVLNSCRTKINSTSLHLSAKSLHFANLSSGIDEREVDLAIRR